MSENVNGLASSLLCHYEETDDVFLIGGLVEPNEMLMAIAIHHYCRHLVDLHLKSNHRLYLAKVIYVLIYHEPVKISIYVMDVFLQRPSMKG
jgi:hypothetical protein